MTSSFFDVVTIGTDPAALAGTALLAKRGFRVLVLGHGDPAPTYRVGGMELPREPTLFTGSRSPATRRILKELALWQVWSRRSVPGTPPLQVVLPDHRVNLSLDPEQLGLELEREMPEGRRPIEEFHRWVERTQARLDDWVGRDLAWPPSSFFERREHAQGRPRPEGRDPLEELPERHPFRTVVEATVRLVGGMDPDQAHPFRAPRLYGNAIEGTVHLARPGGLAALLLERLQSYGAELRLDERVRRVRLRRGTAEGVTLAGSGEQIGAGWVVAGVDLPRLLRLTGDRRPFEELFERRGEPRPRYFRFLMHVVLRREGIPEGLGTHTVFLRDEGRPLHGENLLRVGRPPFPPDGDPASDARLLTVEALLPRRAVEEEPGYIGMVRERVLGALGELVPFFGRHVLLVDSPHDGRRPVGPEGDFPAPGPAWTRGPSTMEPLYAYPVRQAAGLGAFPARTPLRRLLLCNGQLVPGLGDEGRLLAAWTVARQISRADRSKARMRRGLWTRLEV